MKKYPIVLFLLLATYSLKSQDYNISFVGTGESASVGSVTVENLTQGTSLTLNGTEILHLVGTSTGLNPIHNDVDKTLHIFPNPATGSTTIEFVAIAPGITNIELFDITGKKLGIAQNKLTIARHSYLVSGLPTGIYTIRINSDAYAYNGKLVCNSSSASKIKISYKGYSEIPVTAQKLKSAVTGIAMQYTNGDLLKITGSSGNYRTIIMDVPTVSKTITFTFMACSDADGNNYSVLQIGTQWWMAENLKTATYKDGDSIPLVKDNPKWVGLSTPGYCWFNNDTIYKNTYGALYNWFAVNTGKLTPTGWHVPSDAEWSELTTFLGEEDVAGGKLKETGTSHWNAINTGASNTSGFSGLPGGYRDYNGLFKDIANRADFWSSTVANTGDAWYRELQSGNDNVSRLDWYQVHGYSVRCIKDKTDTTSIPLSHEQLQEILNNALEDSQSDYRKGLNQVEYDIVKLQREESGARIAFGDQADDIFNKLDSAKVATIDNIENQAKVLSDTVKNKFQLVTLTSKLDMTSGKQLYSIKDPIERMGGALGTLAGTPFLFEKAHRDVDGNIILPTIESEKTNGNATLRSSLQLKMLGSRLEAQVEIIASITEPFAYEERIVGTMSEEICPDAQGNLPLKFSFHSGVALNGGGQQLGSEGKATGHVNDEGKMETFDAQTKSSGARQPIQGAGDDWGTTNKYFEFTSEFTAGSFSNPKISSFNANPTRASSQVDLKFVNQITPLLAKMNLIMPMIAFWAAEQQWTNGYCVEIDAGGERSVLVNSETPFTAIVRHKFQNTELNVPVIAKLTDGQVSVNPSGSKVVAPANFVYKAPDQKDQKATVNMETISKRGIAKLDVGFKTTEGGWKTMFSGCIGTTTFSCNSPFGPWDINCERPYLDGKQKYTLFIPYSSDGKSRVTETYYWTFPGIKTASSIIVSDITIDKENESYVINFKRLSVTSTLCLEGYCTTVEDEPGDAGKLILYPADPGECQ